MEYKLNISENEQNFILEKFDDVMLIVDDIRELSTLNKESLNKSKTLSF